MKLLNMPPFRVGHRYKATINDFWFEVLSIVPAGKDFWKMEYRFKYGSGETGTNTCGCGQYVSKHVEVPKDETIE